jgi:NADPH-dependent glutamate synthase beta subunit-like oxidoreductase
LLGLSIEAAEPDIARPGCTYGVAEADLKFLYDGVNDCRAAAMLGGGMKVCSIGCLGLGTCARACPFSAISMGPDNLPVVDEKRCTGCGTCERVCPKHIITLSSVTRRILREYTLDHCTTPCQRACPAGIDICEYIRQIALGDYHRAVQVIKERNPFPTVIGRICPRPCELDCRRNLVDEPVAINFLKRFVADYERESGERVLPYKAPESNRKVAVIGGGVEGLSVAFFAARLGHAVTVFEATDKLGGLLRSAIAKERLPMDILDWDIDGVLEMGVTAETGKLLGRDMSIAELLAGGYEAVFFAGGGWDSRLARGAVHRVESPLPGAYLMVDLMRSGSALGDLTCSGDTVIVGAGELALRSAQRCRELGADSVTFLVRETPDESPIPAADRSALEAEGVTLIHHSAVSRLFGEGSGLAEVEVEDEVTGETRRIPARTLVFASGRFPELAFLKQSAGEAAEDSVAADAAAQPEVPEAPESLRWEAVPPYKQAEAMGQSGLFAQGDVLTDYRAAIKAIGAGRRAAASLHKIMYGIALDLPGNTVTPFSTVQNVDHVEKVERTTRQIMPLRHAGEPGPLVELERGFSEEAARREAARCLQCGLICYERPDMNPELKAAIA